MRVSETGLRADEMEDVSFRWLLAGVGALPALSYLGMVLLACVAFAVSGHWPSISYPDPKSLGFSGALSLLWLMFIAAACAAPVYPVIAAIHGLHLRFALSPVDKIGAALYAGGMLLWMLASEGLIVWLLD